MITGPDRMGQWLERALDLSYRRHQVLASNLANLDTPGYVAKDLDFSEQLASELSRPASGSPAAPAVTARSEVEPSLDENKVDLDGELARITANRAFYELATEAVTRRIGLVRYALDEGGR